MAWTKTKKVTTGTAVLSVLAVVVAVKLCFFPSIKDEYFKSSYRQFQKVPGNLLVVRKTHFSFPLSGTSFSSYVRAPSGEYVVRQMGRNVSLERVIATAYQCNPSQIVSPSDKPSGNFDFLVTVPDKNNERFKAAIQEKLGYTAHWEKRDAEVLLLETKMSDPPSLKESTAVKGNIAFKNGKYEFIHMPIATVMGFLESGLKQPVLDRTGLTNFYDFSVDRGPVGPGGLDKKTIEKNLDELGLKLEPGNESVQMLVVEKIH
jgi:uncharacterized protein (TIGR03435 family)